MSSKYTPQYADRKGAVVEGLDGNIILAEGATVPTDATTGYAPGCVFFKRAGTGGASHYINDGTVASCSFKPQPAQTPSTGGMRMARGSTALDGSNPTPVTTGLSTIVAAVATLKRATALNTGTAFVTVDYSGSDGTLNLYGWVAAGTASTGTENVDWIAFGT